MIPENVLEKGICLYLVIVLNSWKEVGYKSRGSWKMAHEVNFKSYLLTLWWVGPFLSLAPPQKVLSFHLKTKLEANPSYSQLAVSKVNTALSTGLVQELAGKFPSPIGGLTPAAFGAQVSPTVWDQKTSFVYPGKSSLAVNLKTPETAIILEKNLSSDWLMCWLILSPQGALGRGQRLLEDILQKNPRLIDAKVSTGMNLLSKYSQSSGDDINFLALSGVRIRLQIGEKHFTTRFLGFLSWRGSRCSGCGAHRLQMGWKVQNVSCVPVGCEQFQHSKESTSTWRWCILQWNRSDLW